MKYLKKIIAIDESTIELKEVGQVGDRINFKDINEVDFSLLREKIKEGNDHEYNRLIGEYRKNHEQEIELAISKALAPLTEENTRLKIEKQALSLKIKQEVTDEYRDLLKKVNDQNLVLSTKLETKEKEINEAIAKAISDTELKYASIKESLALKDQEIKNLKEAKDKDIINEVKIAELKKDNEYKLVIKEKDDKINLMTNDAKTRNVKALGEELESFCNNEMNRVMQNAFKECTWNKDNTVVEGTKADYIFRIYSDHNHNKDEELTSVCLDMKNEADSSVNKKKNSDHYAKLDKDRTKKNCEYAILVSELEWDTIDEPFVVVNDYPNMFMVRPHYMVQLLIILEAFALKSKELKAELNKQLVDFKDTNDILKDFEDLKKNLLDNAIKNITNNIENIKDQASKIEKSARAINESADKIVETHLETVKNKINNFNIEKEINKIKKLKE